MRPTPGASLVPGAAATPESRQRKRVLCCCPGTRHRESSTSSESRSLLLPVVLMSLLEESQKGRLRNRVYRQLQDMSCYTQCVPCRPCDTTPLASSCNEPCVRQCQNSTIVIELSPVVVTLPGPILSSFPQNTVVASSTSAAVGSILSSEGVPITSGGFDLSSFGSRYCGRRCLP
ncbi:feather keratin Cos1-1/Cos1-3/Cos2-1-like [Coturnix japonica]|uniref:feather keratin Cos1-1/Cos1-3/Cos2-1-like n=1 Tax=Coturnix japonica TaxID=93934 RepID=UPI0013A5D9B7|nr:feather keratin Cos1-1/Cos1-3/Cos2-1-like [Coturnix japonica]